MPTDLLLPYGNERVDLVDFEFLADSGFQENLRQPNEQFFTDPSGQRSWVLDGFAIANPAGDQVEVTKGRAILGQREGALVFYGALTIEGDATKTIDMSTLTPNANYGLYLRFEYVDGDTSSRVFWNPAGTGSEIAQSVATRRKANWSIRIELTNPGAEWVKIATLDNTGIGVAITDERPLYFEGEVHNSYQSGWSTDGGGVANDRNADRQQYGVKDFQTFTAAMRQCVEDVKGRGLRRWWSRDIGGMNIGFDAAPVEDRIAIGDADHYLDLGATNPSYYWDATDYMWYDRAANQFWIRIGATNRLGVEAIGTRVRGLTVADTITSLTPVSDRIQVGDANFYLDWDGTDPFLTWDTNDYITYDRSLNELNIWIDGVNEVRIEDDGIITRGIAVSSTLAVTPAANGVRVGISDFFMAWDGTDGIINWAGALSTADYFKFDRSANKLILHINGNDIWTADSVGTETRGLAISSTLGLTPALDTLQVGDADFKLYWDGTDPFLYYDTNTYVTLDRDQNAIKTFINTAFKLQVSLNGVRAPGIAVATNLNLLPSFNRVTIGDADFYLDWDGTNPSIWWDANDLIWFDRNDNRFICSIGTTQRFRVTTTGTHVEGLTVSDPITALTPIQDTVQIGHNRFYLQYDGTDPWIVLDDTDSLWYDRSANQLHVRLGSTNEHTFEPNKARMLGTADPATDLDTEGDYSYDSVKRMFLFRTNDNSGSVDTHEIRGASNLSHRAIQIGSVNNVTTSQAAVYDTLYHGSALDKKVVRVTAYGRAARSATVANLSLWFGLGNVKDTWKMIWDPATDFDYWRGECLFYFPAAASSVSVNTASQWARNTGAGLDHTFHGFQSLDIITGINMTVAVPIQIRASMSAGTGTVYVDMFIVEDLYGET